VLNGNKTWCSGAHLPGTVITILARTGPDRHRGMSLILVRTRRSAWTSES